MPSTPAFSSLDRAARFAPRVRELPRAPEFGALLAALRARPGLVALDSAAGEPRRHSLVAADPVRGADGRPSAPPATLAELEPFLARLAPAAGDPVPGPFAGGFLGALSYDLGVVGEGQQLPRDPWGAPPIAGGLYTDFVVIEHGVERAWLVLGDEPGDGRASLAARERAWLHDIARALARDDIARALAGGASAQPFRRTSTLQRRVPPAEHRRRIECARAEIARGDYYQVNLAHPFEAETVGAPLDLYLRLRAVNPAPYMGYLDFGAGALLSASPELFLELADGLARTRPIKGTSARSADPAEDSRRAAALLASEKDLAELAMIVDLERNDLGRIARTASVRVEGFPRLASYASVHHLMADVVAEPRAGASAFDVLASLFPGGSISGAPKLAAMAAIARLEGEGRGFFSGAFGAIDLAGRVALNLLIRTLVHRPRPERGPLAGEVRYHVGGGITWSSDAALEDEETLAKGARLAAALEAPAGGS